MATVTTVVKAEREEREDTFHPLLYRTATKFAAPEREAREEREASTMELTTEDTTEAREERDPREDANLSAKSAIKSGFLPTEEREERAKEKEKEERDTTDTTDTLPSLTTTE